MPSIRNDLLRQLEELKRKAERVFSGQRKGISPKAVDPKPLMELLEGSEEVSGRGSFFRCMLPAEEVWEDASSFYEEYLEAIAEPRVLKEVSLGALASIQSISPSRVCYLDIETTGLSASPLFLIGMMYEIGGRLYLDQLFARDYSEEEAVLDFFNSLFNGFKVVVTFNGARFDIPFIAERMAYHKIFFEVKPHHIDLLPISREIVGKKTPDHKLQTLERFFCGRKRIGDIPGHEIPDAYHDFVRTGDASDIRTIFYHNRLDLVTMLQLVTIYLSRSNA